MNAKHNTNKPTNVALRGWQGFFEQNPKIKNRDDVFVHFTNVQKLGINPKATSTARVQNPIGIYSHMAKHIDRAIFATGRDYAIVFKLKEDCNRVVASKYSEEQFLADYDKLLRLTPQKDKNTLNEAHDEFDASKAEEIKALGRVIEKAGWTVNFADKMAHKTEKQFNRKTEKEEHRKVEMKIGRLLQMLSKNNPDDKAIQRAVWFWNKFSDTNMTRFDNVPKQIATKSAGVPAYPEKKNEYSNRTASFTPRSHSQLSLPAAQLLEAVRRVAESKLGHAQIGYGKPPIAIYNAIFRWLGYGAFVDDGFRIFSSVEYNCCVFDVRCVEWQKLFKNENRDPNTIGY